MCASKIGRSAGERPCGTASARRHRASARRRRPGRYLPWLSIHAADFGSNCVCQVRRCGRTRPGAARIRSTFGYHDREWGFPVNEDRRLFEKICLEGFQAGLELAHDPAQARPRSRRPSHGFDFDRVARMGARDVERLLGRRGHRAPSRQDRVDVNNARPRRELTAAEGRSRRYFWRWEPPPASRPARLTPARCSPTADKSPESVALAQGSEAPRLVVRRPDDRVRVHAGDVGPVDDHYHDCATRRRRGSAGALHPLAGCRRGFKPCGRQRHNIPARLKPRLQGLSGVSGSRPQHRVTTCVVDG